MRQDLVNYLPQGWRPWARASLYAWDPVIVPGLRVSVWQYGGRFVRVYRLLHLDTDPYQNSPSARPVFVLIHGIGVSARYFVPLMRSLHRYGDVLTVDLPGFSNLPNPRQAMSITEYAKVLEQVLCQAGYLGKKKPSTIGPTQAGNAPNIVIMGHSMGAQIAAELVARNNTQLRRTCLIGPPVYLEERTLPEVLWRFMQSSIFESPRLSFLAIRAYLACGPVWMIKTLPAMMAYTIEETVAHLEGQLLLVRGQHDRVAPTPWLEDLSAYAQKTTSRPIIFQINDGAHGVIHRYAPVVARLLAALAAAPATGAQQGTPLNADAPRYRRQHQRFDDKLRALTTIAARHAKQLTDRSWRRRLGKQIRAGVQWVSVAAPDFSFSALNRTASFLRYPTARRALRGETKNHGASDSGPIVFVPGIFEDWRALVPMGRFLAARGFDTRHLPQLGYMLAPWEEIAQRLSAYLENENLQNVTLLAHSKGGLVAKAVLAGPSGWRIKQVITLGTPWQGSALADKVPQWHLYADLATNYPGTVTQYANRDVNKKIVSITARYDQQVPNSQYLPGARNLRVRAAGHNRLISHHKTWQVVADLLRETPPNKP